MSINIREWEPWIKKYAENYQISTSDIIRFSLICFYIKRYIESVHLSTCMLYNMNMNGNHCLINITAIILQSYALLNWNYFRFRCGCTPVTENRFLLLFHHFFAIFKSVVHSWSLVRRRVTRRLTGLQTTGCPKKTTPNFNTV